MLLAYVAIFCYRRQMGNEKLFDFFKSELGKRRSELRDICRAISPKKWERLYSWMTKALDGRIGHPSVHRVQLVADWLKANPRSS